MPQRVGFPTALPGLLAFGNVGCNGFSVLLCFGPRARVASLFLGCTRDGFVTCFMLCKFSVVRRALGGAGT
jgi:hypothetical protein